MSRVRSVVERVEEFRQRKRVNLRNAEMAEMLILFGEGMNYCDAFHIMQTIFYFGYMKGLNAKKGGKS